MKGNIKRKTDRLSADEKSKAVSDIIHFFEEERNEEIGQIAASQVLDFFMEAVSPLIYNKGILDAKSALQSRIEEANYDLDELLDL